MPKYNIDLVWRQGFSCEAETRQEAVKLAKAAYPNHQADSCINYCEDCDKVIFDDDASVTDSEHGITLCDECTPPPEEWENMCFECEDVFKVIDMKACPICGEDYCKNCLHNHHC